MSWYETTFVTSGRSAGLWLMVAFVLTFALTRWVTHRIRVRELSGRSPHTGGMLSNISIGGLHVHHQVWGILLVLVTGLLQFRYSPTSPWLEVLAALFGAGAALALDEFALWLHLEDVYWSAEGRKSIDAVLVAAVVGFGMLMQVNPIGLETDGVSPGLVVVILVVHFVWVIVAVLKGKLMLGLVGIVIPLVAFVAALRLAKPTSYWAHRRYSDAKMTNAHNRYSEDYQRRWDRIRDWIGRAPGERLQASLDHFVNEEIRRATVDESPPHESLR